MRASQHTSSSDDGRDLRHSVASLGLIESAPGVSGCSVISTICAFQPNQFPLLLVPAYVAARPTTCHHHLAPPPPP